MGINFLVGDYIREYFDPEYLSENDPKYKDVQISALKDEGWEKSYKNDEDDDWFDIKDIQGIPFTREFADLNRLNLRDDGTYCLSLSKASYGSGKEQFIYVEFNDDEENVFINIVNGNIELKKTIKYIHEFQHSLCDCELSHIAFDLKIIN